MLLNRRICALLAALLLALPLAGMAEAASPEDAALVEALPVEAEVPEAGEALLPEPEDASLPVAAVSATEAAEEESPGEEEEATGHVVALARTKLTLGKREYYTLKFQNGVSAKDVGAVFTSSRPDLVSVSKTTGRLHAKHTGKVTITAKLANGTKCKCSVTVKRAPSSVTLSESKLKLGVGEAFALTARLSKDGGSVITYKSSNPKVAAVDENGCVTALKKGTAKITATTFNNKKDTCTVTVKRAPTSITLDAGKLALWKGDSHTLKVKLSSHSAGSYTLSTSDAGVVSVSGDQLKAKGIGTATVTAITYNGKKARVKVTVSRRPVYRALLIGESNFPGTGLGSLPGKKDADSMKAMLQNVKGAARRDWSITVRYNRMANKIHSDIQTAFADAQEGDVSLFYISTHGDEVETMDGFNAVYAGALYTYPNPDTFDWFDRNVLTLTQLAEWLEEVPGQVVVFIDSCGSGAAIYQPKGAASTTAYAPETFNAAVVEAFAAHDRGVLAPGDKGAFVVKNKFYVMTSTAYLETGWSSSDRFSYFTKWLTDGVGTSGDMPADANADHVTTLSELYGYVSSCAKAKVFNYEGETFQQHVQVYPANSSLGLFYRK